MQSFIRSETSQEQPKSALYQRLKIVKWGDPLTSRNFPIFLNVIFEQCHSAENVKGGTLWDFVTSIVLPNIETNERGTLWCNPKNFKKSRIVPKKVRPRWDP